MLGIVYRILQRILMIEDKLTRKVSIVRDVLDFQFAFCFPPSSLYTADLVFWSCGLVLANKASKNNTKRLAKEYPLNVTRISGPPAINFSVIKCRRPCTKGFSEKRDPGERRFMHHRVHSYKYNSDMQPLDIFQTLGKSGRGPPLCW
jgi:hypothetical protein